MTLRRRAFLIGGGAALLGGGIFAAKWFNIGATNSENTLTPDQALKLASAKEITLIDIRRPGEWARTGIGQGAIPIDMRRPDFIETLMTHVNSPTDRIALICARGVRTRKVAARLRDAGFSNIIDIPEGMLGSGAGPGWLKRGLPVSLP